MSGVPEKLDAPGTRCALESHGCSHLISGAGGFDQHHPVPVELGGDLKQPLLALCPMHHRRQHALIRYLVECDEAGVDPATAIMRRFRSLERHLATTAVAHWVTANRPAINGWPCPAART